jgi:serine phosphatase RsbU (regulator of sigma subunit)
LILADVSGHGAAVADMARSLRDLMRRNINRKSQSRLVGELNRQFNDLARLSRFATALVATYLANRQQLTLCNAGHPRPLWYRAASDQWSFVDADDHDRAGRLANLPLGVDTSTAYPQLTLEMNPGDIVFFYTDALTELADSKGEMLGEQGLRRLMESIRAADAPSMAQALVTALERHHEGRAADDDATFLLLFHRAYHPKRLSIGEKIDVYAKVFGLKPV